MMHDPDNCLQSATLSETPLGLSEESSFPDSTYPGEEAVGSGEEPVGASVLARDRHVSAADEAIENREFEQAASELSRALQFDRSRADLLARRGDVWRALGRADEAIADYTASLDLDSECESVLLSRGQIFLLAGRQGEAVSDFSRALELNPFAAVALLGRGRANAHLGNALAAKSDYSRVIEIAPSTAEAYLERGTVLMGEENFSDAIADFSSALELNPFLWLALARRATANSRLGQFDCAVADLTSALRLDPKNAGMLADRAEALLKLGHVEAAFDNFNEAVALSPREARIIARRGAAHLTFKRYDRAEADLTEALMRQPENHEWLGLRGDARLQSGVWDLALEDYEEAARLAPHHPAAYHGQGQVYLASGNPDTAIEYFNRAIECSPDEAEGYYERARCHLCASRFAEAKWDATQAIELDPTAIPPRLLRAELSLRTGQLEEAETDIADLERMAPDESRVHYLRGKLQYRLGRLDAAVEELTQSIKKKPNSGDALGARGGVFRALGRHTDALADLAAASQYDSWYVAEYLVQSAIVNGSYGQYDRAFAELIAALKVDPSNRSALRAKKKLQDQRNADTSSSDESDVGRTQSNGDGKSGTWMIPHELRSVFGQNSAKPPVAVSSASSTSFASPPRVRPAPAALAPSRQPAARAPVVLAPPPRLVTETPSQAPAHNTVAENEIEVIGEEELEGVKTVESRSDEIVFESSLPEAEEVAISDEMTLDIRESPSDEVEVDLNDDFTLSLDHASATDETVPETVATPTAPKKLAPVTAKSASPVPASAPSYTLPPYTHPTPTTRPRPTVLPKREEPQDFLQKYGRTLLLPAGLVLVGIIILAAIFSGPSSEKVNLNAPIGNGFTVSHKLTADDYWLEFAKDNAAASLKYDEISIEITGKVSRVISEDRKRAVLLQTSTPGRCIECLFMNKAELGDVKAGDDVVIVGEGRSRSMPSTDPVLDNCRFRK